jgi:hypothetical protein
MIKATCVEFSRKKARHAAPAEPVLAWAMCAFIRKGGRQRDTGDTDSGKRVCKEEVGDDQGKEEVGDGRGKEEVEDAEAIQDADLGASGDGTDDVAENDYGLYDGFDDGDNTISEVDDGDSTESDLGMRMGEGVPAQVEEALEAPMDDDLDLSQMSQASELGKPVMNSIMALLEDREADAVRYAVQTSPWKHKKGPLKYPGLEISRPGTAVPTASDACLVPHFPRIFPIF